MKNRTGRKKRLLIGLTMVVLLIVFIAGMLVLTLKGNKTGKITHVEDEEMISKEIYQEEERELKLEKADLIETIIEQPPQEVAISEQKEAPYEHWLAAGMIVAASMNYPELEISSIYLAGESEISDKSNSEGVYIVFNMNDEKTIMHSKPIDEERKEAGKTDLYTANLGFATFDIVDVDMKELEKYKQLKMEELSELISQSLLVSIYEH